MRVPQKPNWTKWDHNQHYHHTPLSSGPQRPRRALDVGCGNGVFARRLAERCDHVVALDRDPDTLEVARRHSADPAVEYLEGDLLTAPLEDSTAPTAPGPMIWDGGRENRCMLVDASSHEAVDLLNRAGRVFGGADDGATGFALADAALAFVAVDGDEILGWCWGYFLPRPDGTAMAYLHELEVAAQHRRQGIGRQLMRAFAAAAVSRGASRMFLTTGGTNAPARALYDSLGGTLAEQGPTVNYWFRLPLP